LPNNKKVIPFRQPEAWTFFDWIDANGSNPIEEWLERESDEVNMTFNSVLKEARKRRNHLEWPCYRHKMDKQLGVEGVCELGFKVEGRQYRLFVKFDGVLRMVILCGCYHKQNRRTPEGALKVTLARAKALSQRKAGIHERTISIDI
jgi:putative component of toxin-antitoxin plasmid stabilization module